MDAIEEWRSVDAERFRREIVPRGKPALLKGLVADWPAVREARRSPIAIAAYLKSFDRGRPTQILVAPPAAKGRLFYNDGDVRTLNFERRQERVGAAVDWLIAHAADAEPMTLAVQSAPLCDHLPGFERENTLALPSASSVPRIWIGNKVEVATHFDYNYNIACVVAGRRRFTLFPPGQLGNLYVGPFDHTPAGLPTSMVALDEPDLARYPRFADALAAASQAELEPGDAIYIPYMWWHHVRSLDAFSVLVNYWWNDVPAHMASPFNCLAHALIALRNLPPDQREAWRLMFEHYVFDADPAAHLAPADRGLLGDLPLETVNQARSILARALSRVI